MKIEKGRSNLVYRPFKRYFIYLFVGRNREKKLIESVGPERWPKKVNMSTTIFHPSIDFNFFTTVAIKAIKTRNTSIIEVLS